MANPCYPADIPGFKLEPEEVADVWKYAKDAYIDRGVSNISDTIHGVAADLGLRPEWVARAFTEPKAIRKISNEVYEAMAKRRQAVQQAKGYVRSIDTPGYKKVLQGIVNAPFSVAVFGHGTVGMQTHAGASLFRPTQWNLYFKNFGRQFKFMNVAEHEAAIQHLVRDPSYTEAKRAGLAVDPAKVFTDYEIYGKLFSKTAIKPIRAVLEMGQRGFDVLKVYRLEQFKSEMERLPASLTSDPKLRSDTAKNIAEMINHSTGVSDIGYGPVQKGLSHLAFAAKLEGSRWARIIGDPLKTVDTFLNWKGASAADRHIALTRVRHAAEFTAFYLSTLFANNAILQASGSQSRVNLTDPTKADWLKHKLGDRSIGLEGSLLGPVRFLAQLSYALAGPRSKFQKGTHETRFDTVGRKVASYARGKLSPFYGTLTDVATGSDFTGRPLPTFNATAPRKGQTPYTWPEYLLEQRGPIPLSGATREMYDSFREQGMSALQTTALLKGLSVMGGEMTGAKIGGEYQQKKPLTLEEAMRARQRQAAGVH